MRTPSLRFVASLAAALLLAACRDTVEVARPRAADPATQAQARVEFSRLAALPDNQSAMTVRVLPGIDGKPVASFTASVAYDAARLRFLGDLSGDRGTVVVNGTTPGLVRLAGFNASGFADGVLVTLAFEQVQDEVGTPELNFTELHTIDGNDLKAISVAEPIQAPKGIR